MVKAIHQSWMAPFFVESLIDDKEPRIVDRDPRIDMCFARIDDRDAIIVDKIPLIDHHINPTTREKPDTNLCQVQCIINLSSIVQLGFSN